MSTKNKTLFQVRQGDVYIREAPKNTKVGKAIEPDSRNRTVLAEGEVTGHFHSLPSEGTQLFMLDDEEATKLAPSFRMTKEQVLDSIRVLKVEKQSTLTHDEHGPINVPPGVYHVYRQREYSPLEHRVVMD